MEGVLVIDKPAGPTSHDVVARIRRALGERRVGHTGTLDPFATGVLPLVLGRATRIARFLSGTDKTYDASIRLGITTDTYDATGRVTSGPASQIRDARSGGILEPDRAAIEAALVGFTGSYLQRPPPFSAKKIDGVRAYARAREGEPVEPDPVMVHVHELRLESLNADVIRITVRCSAGFYVRALAHALGERLGIGAHLEALRRTSAGGFGVEDAVPLEVVEREPAAARRRIVPLSGTLLHLPAWTLSETGVGHARHGRILTANDFTASPDRVAAGPVRLIGPDGELVAIARGASSPGALHPFVVMG